MPIPLALAIPAATALVGQGANMVSNFIRYRRERADNLANWNRQNAYNTPAAQMKRYTDAGLNPNLVYSQGNAGNASPVQSPSVNPPQIDLGEVASKGIEGLQAHYAIEQQKLQNKNLIAQNDVIQQEKALKEAQTIATLIGANRNDFALELEKYLRDATIARKLNETNISGTTLQNQTFDLSQKTRLADINAEYRGEQLRKLKQDIKIDADENDRHALMNASNLKEAAQRILNYHQGRELSRAQVQHIQQRIDAGQYDRELNELELKFKKYGLNAGSPDAARVFVLLLEQIFGL